MKEAPLADPGRYGAGAVRTVLALAAVYFAAHLLPLLRADVCAWLAGVRP